MIFVALGESADLGRLILVDSGLLRWHLRRDGVVVIREILVLPDKRRQGIGRNLIQTLYATSGNARRVLQARCPTKYESGNAFWRAMGFTVISEKDGINLWQRPSQG